MTTRRQFLATGAFALGAPLFVSARALGRDDKAAANDRIVMGVIGTGGQGSGLTGAFAGQKDVEIVAVCDVDERHLKAGKQTAEKRGAKKVATYRDFRDLIAHKGLNAVVVATPDHWHALATIAACK